MPKTEMTLPRAIEVKFERILSVLLNQGYTGLGDDLRDIRAAMKSTPSYVQAPASDAALAMIRDLMALYVSACGHGDSVGEAKANARSADATLAKALKSYGFTAEEVGAGWDRFYTSQSISNGVEK
jgi:hypothetical protein